MTVHDVAVDDLGAGVHDIRDLLAEVGEVRRQDRRRDAGFTQQLCLHLGGNVARAPYPCCVRRCRAWRTAATEGGGSASGSGTFFNCSRPAGGTEESSSPKEKAAPREGRRFRLRWRKQL